MSTFNLIEHDGKQHVKSHLSKHIPLNCMCEYLRKRVGIHPQIRGRCSLKHMRYLVSSQNLEPQYWLRKWFVSVRNLWITQQLQTPHKHLHRGSVELKTWCMMSETSFHFLLWTSYGWIWGGSSSFDKCLFILFGYCVYIYIIVSVRLYVNMYLYII